MTLPRYRDYYPDEQFKFMRAPLRVAIPTSSENRLGFVDTRRSHFRGARIVPAWWAQK